MIEKTRDTNFANSQCVFPVCDSVNHTNGVLDDNRYGPGKQTTLGPQQDPISKPDQGTK